MVERPLAALSLGSRHLALLRALLQHHAATAEVWAYGSRVNGDGHDASDLDLVLRDPSHLSQPSAEADALREACAESNLPIRVDVVDWAGIPASFRAEIERGYVVLQRPATATPAKAASGR